MDNTVSKRLRLDKDGPSLQITTLSTETPCGTTVLLFEQCSRKILEDIIHEKGIHENQEQEMALRIVCEHVIERNPIQLLMHLSGTGGTGKSYIIGAIIAFFQRIGCSSHLRVTAPTGCAAVLIRGSTIHSLTGLPKRKGQTNQSELEDLWRGVTYLIIDEVSMISAKLLSEISHRLSLAKSGDVSAADKPFGNVNVIFTGDLGQLKPVAEQPVFGHRLVQKLTATVTDTPSGQSALHGACLWRQVNTVVILRKNWRARHDVPYINLLEQVRKGIGWTTKTELNDEQSGVGGNYQESDYDTLRGRQIDHLMSCAPAELEAFRDAPIIVSRKRVRDAINFRKARMFAQANHRSLYLYKSKDFCKNKEVPSNVRHLVWSLSSSTTEDMLGILPLCSEMPVMITENISVSNGVVNGTQGTVDSVSFTVDDDGNRYATCVFVRVPDCNICLVDGQPDIVPVMSSTIHFRYSDSTNGNFMVKRIQLPVLPTFVFTDYKAQGCSLEYVVLDLSCSRSLQSVYVMLSRAVRLKRILILRWFAPQKVYQTLSQDMRDEFLRIENLARETIVTYNENHTICL